MRDIPIKNSYILFAIVLYWVAGYLVGLSVSTLAVQTAIASFGTILAYLCLGSAIGGGVCKGFGVAYLWLGFTMQFVWFVGLTFFFLGAIAFGFKLANPKASNVPALPVMMIVMAVIFPQGEFAKRLVGTDASRPVVSDQSDSH